MKPNLFFEKITQHFEQKLPFVAYNKPHSGKLVGVFQNNDALFKIEDFNEKGFAFASFDGDDMVLIPHDQSQVLIEDFEITDGSNSTLPVEYSDDENARSKYTALVQKAIDAINKGDFGKVVLSRKETVSLPDFNLNVVFQKLLQNYPTAFTYCFFHPETGLWLGAFSEQLIRVKNRNLHTMAVAGTQLHRGDEAVVWGNKEKAEQQFVTDFILEGLNDYVSEQKVSKPYTMKAGNLLHIKTDIEAALNEPSNLKEVIDILHPTPAVCGFPKLSAKDFILNNEGYDREFYAGYLGEFNHDFEKDENSTDLYVNLRCMQVHHGNNPFEVDLYVGGGITKDSVPAHEWSETVNKTKTIKKILF